MLFKLLRYRINITYLLGKDMVIAGVLSRSCINDPVADDQEMKYMFHDSYNNVDRKESST